MSAPRGHLLTVTKADDWTEDDPSYRWSITCLTPGDCDGWEECGEPHVVNGISAADGPYENDCPGWHGGRPVSDQEAAVTPLHWPWCDEEEFEFHGAIHTWRYPYGWTVPFDGCVVAGWAYGADEIAYEHGEGVHVIDDDWDDTELMLIYVSTVPTDVAKEQS